MNFETEKYHPRFFKHIDFRIKIDIYFNQLIVVVSMS